MEIPKGVKVKIRRGSKQAGEKLLRQLKPFDEWMASLSPARAEEIRRDLHLTPTEYYDRLRTNLETMAREGAVESISFVQKHK